MLQAGRSTARRGFPATCGNGISGTTICLVPRADVVGCYGLGSLHVEAEPSPMPGSGRPLPRPAIVVSGLGVKETPTS